MKIIRCATIGLSLNIFCKGILQDLKKQGYEVVALSSPDENLHELAEREQVKTYGVYMDRHINPVKDMKSLWSLYRVFRDEKPDMIHSMTPKAGLLCMIAGWLARVPIRIHTFTGLVWPTAQGLKRRILMTTDWLTCACATHVIPEGYGVMNDLQEHITSKPMKVLGFGNVMGLDLKKYSLRDEISELAQDIRVSDTFTFLYVGRIVGDKGINELVKAYDRLVQSRPNVKMRMILVGSYEERLDPILPETRQRIENLASITHIEWTKGEQLIAYYAAADCLVMPSYREGFPNTVLEAGAMELPSVVTDINGSNEIIGPAQSPLDGETQVPNRRLKPGETMSIRENGVVVPSKDADALYEAMIWMMDHEEERKQMGRRAREIVSQKWEQGFVREQLYAYYREVTGNNCA